MYLYKDNTDGLLEPSDRLRSKMADFHANPTSNEVT